MRPGRYIVRVLNGGRALADTDDFERAKDYARRWARTVAAGIEIEDTHAVVFSAPWYTPPCIVYTAHAPRAAGIPLPRSWNAPTGE